MSQVYAVQLVDDGGTIFPLIDVIELEATPPKRKEKKEFTSLFRLEPALLQQAPNPTKHTVGYLNPSVFMDRTQTRPAYKIRVISKKTGRKIDFNVLYKLKKSTNDGNLGDISVDRTKKKNVLISYASLSAKCKQICAGAFRDCSNECKKDMNTHVACLGKCGGALDSCKQNCSTAAEVTMLPEVTMLSTALPGPGDISPGPGGTPAEVIVQPTALPGPGDKQ